MCGGCRMIKDISTFYSKNAKSMRRSEIRDLLKFTRQPDLISFAGGLPAPETFPLKDIENICIQILHEKGALALQYGPTEGEYVFRQQIANWMAREKPTIKPENILVTSGSQQGLDILGRVFLDPSDIAIVEIPSYIGALQAFTAYRAKLVGIPQDDEGMRIDLLEKALDKFAGKKKKPKFIYVVPDFQNPSGVTMSLGRRRKLLQLAYKHEIPVVEDSPYRDLRFTGQSVPPIYALDKENQVMMLGTFSKLLCPGLRLGWLMAPTEWMDRMVVAKQAMDLNSPSFTQLIAAEYIKRGLLKEQIKGICQLYKKKRQLMLDALQKYMPKGVTWTKPEGGLFLWVRLPKKMSANDLFLKAIDNKVAYVIGSAFHCNGKGQNTMRLNFSYASDAQIDEGIKRLAKMIKENIYPS
jgi:2-aminoadipate transaminase